MTLFGKTGWGMALLSLLIGCDDPTSQPSGNNAGPNQIEVGMQRSSSLETKVGPKNEFGFAKVSIRDGDNYQEGIVDGQGNEVVQVRSSMLVSDITGKLALVQLERKFLFVPLDGGFVSSEDLDSVNGFQYAEPYSCGLAMVSVNDRRFYIDTNFEKAFGTDFEFAESFHHDRALVKDGDRYRIIDTLGKSVSDLNYDQVSPQSPWCWQVINKVGEGYRHGFVDLNGNRITELIFDDVGYYDAEVKRIRVHTEAGFGFLDEFAKVAIPIKYEYAEPFDRGKARVVLGGRSFFIDPDGMEVPVQ